MGISNTIKTFTLWELLKGLSVTLTSLFRRNFDARNTAGAGEARIAASARSATTFSDTAP